MLLAGYARLAHGTYFLLHNSWGTGWGDGGYAWLHEATLSMWVHEAVAVDAEPIEKDPSNRPRRKRGEVTCAGAPVPDSITGSCAAPCPDGSPRHDDVCPVASQCPAGYVNLIGDVRARGADGEGERPGHGRLVDVRAGRVQLHDPKARDPGCTGAACEASCPAPDYRIGRMGDELVCLE